MRIALAVLFLTFAPGFARAAPEARAAYDAGDFLSAADAGEAEGRASTLSLAAQALLARCVTDPKDVDVDALLDRAAHNAQAALDQQPDSVSARLQLALALGMKGKRANIAEALAAHYAPHGRRLIGEALALDPHEPWAYALLGGWNLEVLRRGGGLGARLMGASYKDGVQAFERARALAPNDPAIAVQYAVALLALDPQKHEAKAGELLEAAANAPAKDAFESFMREEARRLSAVLGSQGAIAAAQSAAAVFL